MYLHNSYHNLYLHQIHYLWDEENEKELLVGSWVSKTIKYGLFSFMPAQDCSGYVDGMDLKKEEKAESAL